MKAPLLLSLALFLALSCLPCLAQESLWDSYYQAGATAYEKGNYAEAEKYLLLAQSSAEALAQNDPRHCLAATINLLAAVYDSQGKYDKAEPLYNRALDIYEKAQPPEKANLASVLNNLAELYRAQGRYLQAEPLYNTALATRKEVLPAGDPDLATSLNNLALLYDQQNKYKQAQALFLQALEIWKAALGPRDPQVATCMNNLGVLYEHQGKYAEAQKFLLEALELRKSIFGPDSPKIATTLHNLVALAYAQGKNAEAESLSKRSVEITEKALGPEHPNLATSLHALGSLDRDLGKYDEAAGCFGRSFLIREKALGLQHPDTALSLVSLIDIFCDQNKYAEAEPLCIKLLARDESLYGQQDPKVASDLDKLASIDSCQGKSETALQLRKRSQAIKQGLPGGQRLGVLPIETGLGGQKPISPGSNRPVQDKWALVIGISNFKDPSITLQFAAKDATDFSNFLVNECHFQKDHIKLLTDEKATRENIISCLGDKWLGRLANPDDLVLVFFSTHGSNSEREAVGVNFVVTYDTNTRNLLLSGLPMEWLTKGIQQGVHCDRVVLFLDVCHSGAAAATRTDTGPAHQNLFPVDNLSSGKGLVRQNLFNVNSLSLGKGQAVLASSAQDQTSWESTHYPNGVFTHYLIEALRRRGDNTRLKEAYEILKEKVEQEVLRDRAQLQTPVLKEMWEGADPVVAALPVAPRPGLEEDGKTLNTQGNTRALNTQGNTRALNTQGNARALNTQGNARAAKSGTKKGH